MKAQRKKAEAGTITLRAASEADAGMTFRWRNSPMVRRHSHDDSELTLAGHILWWNATLADPNRHLLIAAEAGTPVGVLRLDRADDSAIVSIYFDPQQTGRGLGPMALDVCAAYAARRKIRTLIASISEANQASRSAFGAAGFEKIGEDWIRVTS